MSICYNTITQLKHFELTPFGEFTQSDYRMQNDKTVNDGIDNFSESMKLKLNDTMINHLSESVIFCLLSSLRNPVRNILKNVEILMFDNCNIMITNKVYLNLFVSLLTNDYFAIKKLKLANMIEFNNICLMLMCQQLLNAKQQIKCLQSLVIDNCKNITDQTMSLFFQSIQSKLPQLRLLYFQNMPNISYNTIDEITKCWNQNIELKGLKHVKSDSITNAGVFTWVLKRQNSKISIKVCLHCND